METPHAQLKDLRSTGYFFNELKSYSESPAIDVETYCLNFAVPYLVRLSEAYDKTEQSYRSRILRFAIGYLSCSYDSGLVESILGLKKVVASEIDREDKAVSEEQFDKLNLLSHRQRLESAKLLLKLLVSIIKLFRLANPNANVKRAERVEEPIFEAMIQSWEALENSSN